MKTILLAVVTMALLAGCSEEAKPLTPEVLDAAVRAAAGQLLDSPGIETTSFGYDENGGLRATTWFDWRTNGDGTMLGARPGTDHLTGNVKVGDATAFLGSRLVNDNVVESEVWTLIDVPSPTGRFLPYVDEMAAGNLDGLSDADGDIIVANEPANGGGILWRMVVPVGPGTVTREWLIDSDGYLRAWTWETSPGFVISSESRVEVRFDPLATPTPIVLPEEGTEMDPALLGFPEDLPIP